jgi:hypothetical protein
MLLFQDKEYRQVIDWLLEGDPAIRWQIMRDLQDNPPSRWQAEQKLVAAQGWGARLLSQQDDSGRWTPKLYGQKWISTTYSMVLLQQLGLTHNDPRARKACALFLAEGFYTDGGINLSRSLKQSEECVTGMVLGLLSWFEMDDPRRDRLVEFLLRRQMPDGGWNCLRHKGARHSSFHTTINVLEGLRQYAEAEGSLAKAARKAEERAREFFLQHRLYRSHRTNEIVDPAFIKFSFPPRWHHDIMRTLDYFRASGAGYDRRLLDPLQVLLKKQRKYGKWVLQNRHPGVTFFEMEEPGKASRWNTLRALRILKWWDKIAPAEVQSQLTS